MRGNPNAVCEFSDDCTGLVESRGFCKNHYYQLRRKNALPMKICKVRGCYIETIIGERDYCTGHLSQYRKLLRSKIYTAWANMRARCLNENGSDYHNYGGRGIKFDDSWQLFLNFYLDMREGFKEELTLDRKDVNKGYNKDNCRWVTMRVQGNNKRNNRYITYNGRTQSLTLWMREQNISKDKVYKRLAKGIPEIQALELVGVSA